MLSVPKKYDIYLSTVKYTDYPGSPLAATDSLALCWSISVSLSHPSSCSNIDERFLSTRHVGIGVRVPQSDPLSQPRIVFRSTEMRPAERSNSSFDHRCRSMI